MIEEVKEIINNDILSPEFVEKEKEVNPFSHFVVYKKNKSIIGYLYYSLIYDRIEINQIEVLKSEQHKGIGTLLMDYLIKKNMDITLEVKKDNVNAIKLYEKFSFKKVAIRKGYYNGVDGVLMERKVGDNMKDTYILGIESSCDETSCSIVKNGCEEIATIISSQIDIHKDYGGVVPEIASRNHVKNITIVIEECLEKADMTMDEIDAIAITYGPGLIGSLLVGVEAAKTLSFIFDKPLIPVHHIAGHIYANNLVKEMKFPLLALVVSGGHTELIKMDKHYSFEKLGGTLDDAVGECYDKVARVINLEYPGGPKLDALAHEGHNTYTLPIPLKDDSYNFSFSGLKSAVINLAHNEEQRGNELRKADLATSFQKVAVSEIVNKTKKALEKENIKNLIVAGGVAANKGLREEITKMCEELNVELSFPPMKYCTDNAAMIATAGYFAMLDGRKADLSLNSKSTDTLK